MSDLISRQAAIDRINKQREHLQPDIYPQDKIGDAAYRICAEFIERLPSAQPDRKTGWWLIREGISDVQCSECGMYFRDVYDMENSDAFCRHCGTKMEGLKVVKNG